MPKQGPWFISIKALLLNLKWAMALVSGSLLHQKDAFLAAASGTKVGFADNNKLGEGTFGKDG